MWGFTKKDPEIIACTLHPNALSLSWITSMPAPATKNFILKAYKRIPLTHLESLQLLIFNPTIILQEIGIFITSCKLTDPLITCSLEGPGVIMEHILNLPTSSPTPQDFNVPLNKKLVWDYHYLFPRDNGLYAFYITGINRQTRFQYQLLALRGNLNLIVLTTQFLSLLRLYKFHYGNVFRHAQLARDMENNNNQLLNFFTPDRLHRIITVPAHLQLILEEERPYITQALGLYLAGKDLNAHT